MRTVSRVTPVASLALVDDSSSARTPPMITRGYQWAAGGVVGGIPASQFLEMRARYLVGRRFGLYVDGSDVLDQRRFQGLGGAVIGRRVVAGITSEF
jgi:hypothetical protein